MTDAKDPRTAGKVAQKASSSVSMGPPPTPVFPHVCDTHQMPGNYEAEEKFELIKINQKGKRQQRTLAVSKDGIQNIKGSDVQWYRHPQDVFSIEPTTTVDGKPGFALTTLAHYYFEAESEEQKGRIFDCVRMFQIGHKWEEVPQSPHAQSERDSLAKELSEVSLSEDPSSTTNTSFPTDSADKLAANGDIQVPNEQSQQQLPTPSASSSDGVVHVVQDDITLRTWRETDFEKLAVIGKGSFGKVYLVRKIDDGRVYAMKVLRKKDVYLRGQVEHTMTEQSVLAALKHPFLVNLHFSFHDNERLFMVMDFVNGGELFFHLGNVGSFPEKVACFYVAELVMALQFLHEHDIIYRDLKPENILLDTNGHVRLVDFGLAKLGITSVGNGSGGTLARTFCGTPEYLAPEVINNTGHGKAVDWWSLGILLYELLTGSPPFYHENRNEMYANTLRGKVMYPSTMSKRARDLISKLIRKDATRRLGSGPLGAEEIKQHPFFRKIDWKALERKQVKPPFKPKVNVKHRESDVSNFDQSFTAEDPNAHDSDDEFADYFDFSDSSSSGDEFLTPSELDEKKRIKREERDKKQKQFEEFERLRFDRFVYSSKDQANQQPAVNPAVNVGSSKGRK